MINIALDFVMPIVSILAFFISLISIHNTRNTTLLAFYEQGDSALFKKARAKLYQYGEDDIKEIIERTQHGKKYKNSPLPDYEFALLVSFYETWGKLLKKHLLPISTFDGMGTIILMNVFEKLKIYIDYRRKSDDNLKDSSLYACYFEYIYNRVRKREKRVTLLCRCPLLGNLFKRFYYGIK